MEELLQEGEGGEAVAGAGGVAGAAPGIGEDLSGSLYAIYICKIQILQLMYELQKA